MLIKDFFKKYVYPVAMMSGGIIGVGFFSLPYIAVQVGTWPMVFYFLILVSIIVILHLIFAEISLKTPDFKRFPGIVGHYLGRFGGVVAFFSVILGTYGALLAYLIVGSQFLQNIFGSFFQFGGLFYILIYFLIVSAIIWFDVKLISKLEFWILSFLFLSILFIFSKSIGQINFASMFNSGFSLKSSNLFLPYGPILFSLWGISLIPEVEEMMKRNKKNFKKTVVVATLIPALFYLFFIFLIVSISGSQTTESAFAGLKIFLGSEIIIVASLAGLFVTIAAFVSQGLTLKKVFLYDLKIKKWQAFVMTCSVPLILLLSGFNSFISVVSLIGGVLLSINGVLILLMYKKNGGKSFLIYPLLLIFLLGIIYEIIYFIK